MSRKKVSTTIYITPEQADRLKILHERTKVPIAVYIREGIDLMLKHYEHVFPGQMSLEAASLSPAAPAVATSRREPSIGVTAELPRPPPASIGETPRPPAPPLTLRAGSDGGSTASTPRAAVAASASAPQEPPPALASKPSRSGEG